MWESRIVGEGEEHPDQLLANPFNWRIHPKFQQEVVTESLDAVGWIQRIIVNKATGHVIDGHLRVQLALSRDEPTVPVQYVDLTPDEELLALAVLDPSVGLAAADQEILWSIIEDVRPNVGPFTLEMLEGLVKGEAGDEHEFDDTIKLTDREYILVVAESEDRCEGIAAQLGLRVGDPQHLEDVSHYMSGKPKTVKRLEKHDGTTSLQIRF